MPESLDESTVRHVAQLARLSLTDDEVAQFSIQLAKVLRYMDQLNEVATDDVEPTAHSLPITSVFREDAIVSSLGVNDALSNSPGAHESMFQVPKVLDQGDS